MITIKDFSKRDWFTIVLWILFLFALVFNTIWQKHLFLAMSVNSLACVGFGKFMIVRMHLLNGKNWKCALGLHDHDYEEKTEMVGTGRYLAGVEIQKKNHYEASRCKRCGDYSIIV